MVDDRPSKRIGKIDGRGNHIEPEIRLGDEVDDDIDTRALTSGSLR